MRALPEFDLTGKTAIITGGNGGIGKGIATGLGRAGANVVIAARNEAKTAATLEEFEREGYKSAGIVCDVTKDGDAERAVQFATDTFGGVDVLFNNAAYFDGAPASLAIDAWDPLFRTNVRGPYVFMRAVQPVMKAAGGGKIINISSGASTIAYQPNPAYGASKAALDHLTRTMAILLAYDGITVNSLLPGAFRTPTNQMDEAGEKRWMSITPARRIGHVDEFAGIAVFLASPASDFMTGQVFAFDGGVTIPALGQK